MRRVVPPSVPPIRPTWLPSTNTWRTPRCASCFPADIDFKWGVKGDDKIDGRYYLYAIKVSTPDGKAPLDGSVVTSATEQYAQRGATAEVSMTMNGEGTQEWARLTGENIGKCIAIVLDGYVYSAPRVNTKIDKGSSQITGDFTIQEAKDLANVLNSGKVPAPAKIIQDTVVGPSLGQESINAGMLSFVIAFILVLLYMGLFYKTAGWMSDVALLTNVFLLMGVLGVVRRRVDAAGYRGYRPDDGYGRRCQRHHLRTYQGGAARRQGALAGHQGRFLESLLGHHRR